MTDILQTREIKIPRRKAKAEFCWFVGGQMRQLRTRLQLDLPTCAKAIHTSAKKLDNMEWGHLNYTCMDYVNVLCLLVATVIERKRQTV